MNSEQVPLPTYVQIEPVGMCNLRCQMCAIQFRQDGPPYGPPAFMPFDRYKRLVDGFDRLEELHLQGLGEPMMHPRFFDMVAYATGKGIKVTINTNLTLFTPRRAERCVTSGLHTLHLSIDGATAETYERIREGADYGTVLRNLAWLNEARDRLGSDRPYVRLVMVVMRQNLHELPDLVRLAHRWSVQSLFVQHLCHDFSESQLPAHYRPMREFVDEQTLRGESAGRISHYFERAREIAERVGLDLRLPRTRPRRHPPGTPGPKRCSWPWKGSYISYEGYAMPCCMVSTPDRINFGNMAEAGVREIWESDAFTTFREQLASENPPEICRSCAIYNGTF